MFHSEDKVRWFQSLKTNKVFTSRVAVKNIYITFRNIGNNFNYSTIASIKTPKGLFIYDNISDNDRLYNHIIETLLEYEITEADLIQLYKHFIINYYLLNKLSTDELSHDPVIQSLLDAELYGADLSKLNLDITSHRNYLAIVLNYSYRKPNIEQDVNTASKPVPNDIEDLISLYHKTVEKKYAQG